MKNKARLPTSEALALLFDSREKEEWSGSNTDTGRQIEEEKQELKPPEKLLIHWQKENKVFSSFSENLQIGLRQLYYEANEI